MAAKKQQQDDEQQDSFWSKLFDTGASAISANEKAGAANRSAGVDAAVAQEQQRNIEQRGLEEALLRRAADDRAGQTNAWRSLMGSSYAQHYVPPVADVNDPYRRAMPGVSDDMRAGAEALAGQSRDSLMSGRFNTNGGASLPMPTLNSAGNSAPFTIDPKLTQEPGGFWHKLAKYAVPALQLGASFV